MKKRVTISLLILIILLIMFNVKMINLKKNVDYACTEDYSQYVETETCPCVPQKTGYIPDWLLTSPNYSESFNISDLER